MHRSLLAFVLAAFSLVAVAFAAPEVAQSKPARGQQSETQKVRSPQATKRHGKRAKRVVKRGKRAAASAARSVKKTERSAKRHAKPKVKRLARRHVSRVRRSTTRSGRRAVARAHVAVPTDPTSDHSFPHGYYGPITEVARATKPAKRAVALAAHDASFGGGWSDVVSEARRWIGTNPTGRRSLWCARFMNFVLERAGHKGTGSDMARSFANYGRRVHGPQVGAIAVMSRGPRGGHVGVVSGVDENGNPVIISGNHNNRVAEATYPRGRIRAYVMPGS